MRKTLPYLLLPAAMMLGACSGEAGTAEGTSGESGDKPTIVTAFYGLQYTAEQIVGDAANVTTLTQPGQEAHGLELKPSQIGEIGEADMVLYVKQFQPAVDEAVAQSGNEHALDVATVADLLPASGQPHDHDHGDDDHDDHDHADDEHADHDHEGEEGHDHASEEAHDHDHDHADDEHADHDHASEEATDDHEGHDHGDFDPHYWQDPERMAKVGQAIADQLGEQFPEMKDDLQANAKQFAEEMDTLDQEYETGLAQCERKEFITAHAAFQYLADNYGLTEIGISGVNPDGEPSPARIAEVQNLAKEHGVTTIFFETLTSPAVSEAIAGDLGLKTAVLDPLEGITDNSPGEDYPSVMRANLEALKEANGCN